MFEVRDAIADYSGGGGGGVVVCWLVKGFEEVG